MVGWSTGGALSLSRRFGRRAAVSGGIGRLFYGGSGELPDPYGQGEAFQTYIAPELALYARDAATWVADVGASWDVGDTVVWAAAGRASLAPVGSGVIPPFAPGGHRHGWTLSVGALMK